MAIVKQKVQNPNNKVKFSMLDLVSNTEGQSVSATGLCGTIIIFVALVVFVACTIFYFCNTQESNNVFTIINSTVTILGIGAGVLGVRRISSDFGPNNRITIGGSAENSNDNVVYVQKKLYSSGRNTTTDTESLEQEIIEEEQENEG